jgi:hypothetical protein
VTASLALPYASPTDSGEYAADLDAALGATPSGTDLAVTSAWVQSESPGFPGNNGLGTELDLPGAVPDPSNPAVYDYPTLAEGLEAAVDMMLGEGPQTTPLASQFVTDLRSGDASEAALVADVRSSGWAGSAPDNYDADAITSKLSSSGFSVSGSKAATETSTGGTQAELTAVDWNPLSWPGQVLGSATSSLAGTIGVYILKGVLTLVGAAMVVYGGVVLSGRGHGKQTPPASFSPEASSAPAEESAAEPLEPFPEETGAATATPAWMAEAGVAA